MDDHEQAFNFLADCMSLWLEQRNEKNLECTWHLIRQQIEVFKTDKKALETEKKAVAATRERVEDDSRNNESRVQLLEDAKHKAQARETKLQARETKVKAREDDVKAREKAVAEAEQRLKMDEARCATRDLSLTTTRHSPRLDIQLSRLAIPPSAQASSPDLHNNPFARPPVTGSIGSSAALGSTIELTQQSTQPFTCTNRSDVGETSAIGDSSNSHSSVSTRRGHVTKVQGVFLK